MKYRLSVNYWLIIAGVLLPVAYVIAYPIITMQGVYIMVHQSAATLTWLMAMVLWGVIADKYLPRVMSKRNGWIVYIIGLAVLLWMVL